MSERRVERARGRKIEERPITTEAERGMDPELLSVAIKAWHSERVVGLHFQFPAMR